MLLAIFIFTLIVLVINLVLINCINKHCRELLLQKKKNCVVLFYICIIIIIVI